ncbi:MAG: hypothetical protein HY043_02110 [Verrucomicrobia bacterium]|nr:hypothetical protein [Verrucomicrobiota bacterium]
MENPISKKISTLTDQADKARVGAANHGPTINLTQNTAVRIKADGDAVNTTAQDFAWSIADRIGINKTLTDAIQAGVTFARSVKGVLLKYCGAKYNPLWAPVGFKNSLEVPTDALGIKALLLSMADYFTKKPAQEVASLGITAAAAGDLRQQILDAEAALSAHDDTIATNKDGRDTAVEGLRTRLRGLVNELDQLIGKEARRWHSFGFNIPAEPATPGQPVNVTVAANAPGELHIECDAVSYADHYRFWTQPVGSIDAPVDAGSAKEPSLVLENLAGGSQWNVSVSAVNHAGNEGPRSASVQATVLAQAVA